MSSNCGCCAASAGWLADYGLRPAEDLSHGREKIPGTSSRSDGSEAVAAAPLVRICHLNRRRCRIWHNTRGQRAWDKLRFAADLDSTLRGQRFKAENRRGLYDRSDFRATAKSDIPNGGLNRRSTAAINGTSLSKRIVGQLSSAVLRRTREFQNQPSAAIGLQ